MQRFFEYENPPLTDLSPQQQGESESYLMNYVNRLNFVGIALLYRQMLHMQEMNVPLESLSNWSAHLIVSAE